MIVVAGLARMQPGNQEAVSKLIEDVVRQTQSENGCISYQMYSTTGDQWFIFEEWETEEALRAHLAAPHTTAFLGAVAPFMAAPPALKKYAVTSSGPLF